MLLICRETHKFCDERQSGKFPDLLPGEDGEGDSALGRELSAVQLAEQWTLDAV